MYRLSSIFCDFSHYTAENQLYTICCAVKFFCGVYVEITVWEMKNAGRFHHAQTVEKLATGNFFEDYAAKIFHLWGAFFLEKSAPHPCKKAL